MNFHYELENIEGMSESSIKHVERALEISAFVCQQEFERGIKERYEIHFDSADASGAFVTSITIVGDNVYVVLDCGEVEFGRRKE